MTNIQATEKPVRAKKSATAKPKPGVAKKSSTSRKATSAKKTIRVDVSESRRIEMIREAAYFRAEKKGFIGDPAQDWIEAEAEINSLIG